jgi:azurin
VTKNETCALTRPRAVLLCAPFIMATQHDSHDQGGGFWGCANIFLGLFFAACAAGAGGSLILGGMTKTEKKADAPAPPAAAAPAASGDTVAVTIKPGSVNPMSYDTMTINAKAGQKVKITFQNQHPQAPLQHNLIVCKPGSKDAMIAAANLMMTDMPKWLAKGFIPESPDVLHHTKLLNPGETETLEFTAGPAGDYPYICTFPGHSLIMQGMLKVE